MDFPEAGQLILPDPVGKRPWEIPSGAITTLIAPGGIFRAAFWPAPSARDGPGTEGERLAPLFVPNRPAGASAAVRHAIGHGASAPRRAESGLRPASARVG